jgi:hypothetical protein
MPAAPKLRSLQELGQHTKSHETRMNELVAYLSRYQQANPGQTPTIDCMVNELGEEEAYVRSLLASLENKGLIHIISRFPLRISLTGSGLEHVSGQAPELQDPNRDRRFLEADGKRHQLGRFIGQMWQDKARGPSLREMMDHVEYQNAGYVTRMAEILAEKGLVQFGRDVPTRLTAAGERFYGFEKKEPIMTVVPQPAVVVVPRRETRLMNPGKIERRVDQFCKILADYQAHGGGETGLKLCDLAVAMGFQRSSGSVVADTFMDAAERGLVLAPPPNRKRGYRPVFRFTELGRQRYLQPAIDAVEQAWPEEVPAPAKAEVPAESPPVHTPKPTVMGTLVEVPTGDLVMELIERGYIVRKG